MRTAFQSFNINKHQSVIAKYLVKVLAITSFAFLLPIGVSTSADAGTPNPGPNSRTADLPLGAYIIDAGALTSGASKQTINQGLKPYGLVYELVKNKIPVEWVINSAKTAISQTTGNSGTDFTFDCSGNGTDKTYKSGAFVVTADYAVKAKSIIDAWTSNSSNSGLVVDGPCKQPLTNLPIYATIKSWPRVALDAQNGAVAVKYFQNAGIPEVFGSGALTGGTATATNPATYRFVAPSALTACDDVYVMPHADPTYATHSNLINFVKAGGDFYASCHAVSVVENMTNGSTTKVMNFLSTNGVLNYDNHVQGSPAYSIYDTNTVSAYIAANSYVTNYADGTNPANVAATSTPYTLPGIKSGDPIAQFLGVTDAAQQQGSEQIFMPASDSRWRPTTQIVVYDASQSDTNPGVNGVTSLGSYKSFGPAASVLYGPAFGNTNYGQVMYVGGHSSAKGTVDDVAAQRIFFNFLLQSSVNSAGSTPLDTDRTPTVTLDQLSVTSLKPGQSIDVNGNAIGGSGTFKYQWSADCRLGNGSLVDTSGSFANGTSNSATFTAPNLAGLANCNLTLTAIDNCGRFAFGYQTFSMAPVADIRVTVGALTSPAYVGVNLTVPVTVQNLSNSTGNIAGSVTMTMPLPDLTSYSGVSSFTYTGTVPDGATCSVDAGVITCDLKDLQPGQSVSFTITLVPTDESTVVASATVTTSSVDTDLSNNKDSKSTTVAAGTPVPQLQISKTPTTQLVSSGGMAAFRLTVKNTSTGNITLTNISITDTFTTGGTLNCYEGSSATAILSGSTSPRTYTIASLAPNGVWTAGCEITGVTTTGSNSFSATTTYSGTTATASVGPNTVTVGPALTIEKSELGDVSPGGTITYTVKVTNNTGSTQTNVKINEDNLPAGLTPVPGSASISTTDLGTVSTDTNGLIAYEKFTGASISNSTISNNGGSGWASSTTSWALGGDDQSNIKVTSYSDSNNKYEKGSIYFKGSQGKVYSISRKVTLSNNHTNVTVVLECTASSSTKLKFTVSLGNKSWVDNTCSSSSTRQLITLKASKADIGNTATTQDVYFKITTQKNSNDSASFTFDDIFLIANMQSTDTVFTNSFQSGSGFVDSKWTTNSNSKVTALKVNKDTSNSTEKDAGSGVAVKWAPSSSSDTGYMSRSFKLDSAAFTSGKLHFSIYRATASDATKGMKVYLDNTVIYTNSAIAGTSWTAPLQVDVNITPAGTQVLKFEFSGNEAIYLDDIFISASPKGSSTPTSVTNKDLSYALSQGFTLSNNTSMTLEFKVKIANPYPVTGATGLVNLASVTSTSQTTPSYAQQSDPFKLPGITITKTSTIGAVASGSNVTFTYKVKNTGTSTLTGLSVTDQSCSTPATANSGTFSVGTIWTYTCTVNNVIADLLGDTATATVQATDSVTLLPVSNTSIYEILVLNALIKVTASPSPTNIYTGNRVNYSMAVTVPSGGNTPMKEIALTSEAPGCTPNFVGGDDGDLILQTTETWTYVCMTDIYNAAGTTTPRFIVSGKNTFTSVQISDTATVTVHVVAKPVLTLTKQVKDGSSGTPAKTISVTNVNHVYYLETLTVTSGYLNNIKLNDAGCNIATSSTKTGDAGTTGRLETSETWVYTCDAGTVLSSDSPETTAYGTDEFGTKIYSNSDSATVTVNVPGLLLTVEPQKEYVLVGGNDQITYTIKNTGNVTFDNFDGIDSNCTASYLSGGINMATSLAPGESWTITCTYPIPTDKLITFSGTAKYNSNANTFTPDPANARVFAVDPRMSVIKYVKVLDPSTLALKSGGDTATAATAVVGDKIVFRYKVTGSAGAGASSVDGLNAFFKNSYSDADCNSATWAEETSGGFNSGDTNHNGYIDPSESWFFTCDGVASLTSGGASLMASGKSAKLKQVTSSPALPLPKVRNGGLMVSPALKVSNNKSIDATTTHNSPVTITGISNLDDPNAPTIGTLTGSSTVTLTLPAGSSGGSGGGGGGTPAPVTPTYTVTYQNNGSTSGSTPLDPRGYVSGQTVTVLPNSGALSQNGFTFGGWSTSPNGGGSVYGGTGNSIFPMPNSNVILYPIWIANQTSKITYDPNGAPGGVAPVDPNNYQRNSTGTVLGNTGSLYYRGYTFNGWNTAANGSGTSYAPGANVNVGSNGIILFAQWKALPAVTITYNAGGATGGSMPNDTNKYYQLDVAKIQTNLGNLTRTGYKFIGWNTAADGTGTVYPATGNAVLVIGTTNVNLYPEWEKIAIPGSNVKQGKMVFKVYFGMNSVAIDAIAKKNIKEHFIIMKSKMTAKSKVTITVEGWVQPNNPPGNITYLSTNRAKNVTAAIKALGLKGTYRLSFPGLAPLNDAKSRYAEVIFTWTDSK